MTEKARARQNDYFEMAQKARTLHTYFYIISMHSVCQETLFSVANNGERVRGNFRLCLLGPSWQFDWTKLAHCTSRSCILQNKTTIRPLRHILRFFLDKVPL